MSEIKTNTANLLGDLAVAVELDARGLRCPMPLLRAKQALKQMQPENLLKVLSTDPAAKADFEAMLRHLPHELLNYQRFEDQTGDYPWIDAFIIRKMD